jgi:hypothetical protein
MYTDYKELFAKRIKYIIYLKNPMHYANKEKVKNEVFYIYAEFF